VGNGPGAIRNAEPPADAPGFVYHLGKAEMEGVLDLRIGHALGKAPEDVLIFRFELSRTGGAAAGRTGMRAGENAAMHPVQGRDALLNGERLGKPIRGAGGDCAVKESGRAAGSNDDCGEAGLTGHQLPGAFNAAQVRKLQFNENQGRAGADESGQSLTRRPEEPKTPELAGEAENAGEQAASWGVVLNNRQTDWLRDTAHRRTRRVARERFGTAAGRGNRAVVPVADGAKVASW
jgi:hypothetical protein